MIHLREARLDIVEERNYVLATWLRSYAQSSHARHAGPRYMLGQRAAIERCMERARTTVAHPDGEPERILAWMATEPHGLVHYVYVRPAERRKGLARSLLAPYADMRVRYTHAPPMVSLPCGWVYDPFAFYMGDYT